MEEPKTYVIEVKTWAKLDMEKVAKGIKAMGDNVELSHFAEKKKQKGFFG